MSVKLGLSLPLAAQEGSARDFVGELVEEVQAADSAGFDLCLVPDHHQGPPTSIVAPLTFCAGLATVTERIRLGPGVLVLPVQAALHVAEQVTLVDQLSGGRAVLGVGTGYQQEDFEPFGIDRAERGARFEALLQQVGSLLSEDGGLNPAPVRRPRPPILVGAWSAPGIDRAARLADGWLADPIRTVTEVAAMADRYREACGGTPGEVVLMREAWVDDAPDAAERFADAIMPVFRYYGRRGGGDALPECFDDLAADRFVFGSPTECVEQAGAMAAAVGASTVVLTLRQPTAPGHEATVEAIRSLGRAREAAGV